VSVVWRALLPPEYWLLHGVSVLPLAIHKRSCWSLPVTSEQTWVNRNVSEYYSELSRHESRPDYGLSLLGYFTDLPSSFQENCGVLRWSRPQSPTQFPLSSFYLFRSYIKSEVKTASLNNPKMIHYQPSSSYICCTVYLLTYLLVLFIPTGT